MLRYAQLVFKKQNSGKPLPEVEESEIARLLQEIGLSHEAIIKSVTENLIDSM